MEFIAEAVLVLLEITSAAIALFILYLRFGRADHRRHAIGSRAIAPLATAGKFKVSFFIGAVMLTLACTHAALLFLPLWAGTAILIAGLLLAAWVYFPLVAPLIADRSIRYAMMMWAATCIFAVAMLAVMSWGVLRSVALGARFDPELVNDFVAPLAQTAGIIIAATMVILTNRFTADQAKRSAGHAIYQQLEFASIELFRFEADHPELVQSLWFDHPAALTKKNPTVADKMTAYRLEQYACQMLNLFEMELRFRREGIIPPDVFASWVIWIYEVCCLPNFVAIWKEELRPHYILDFQLLVDEAIRIGETDVPHRGQNDKPDWRKVQQFYDRVAELVSPGRPCPEVKNWLSSHELI